MQLLFRVTVSAATLLGTAFAQDSIPLRGVRPEIPLSAITAENTVPGVIRIKLTAEAQNRCRMRLNRSSGRVETNLESLDLLNRRFGAKGVTPTFANLENAGSRAGTQQRENHKRWGFDRWYDISIDSDSLHEVLKAYRNLPEVAVSEPVFKIVRHGASEWIPNDPQFKDQWHYKNSGQKKGGVGADINLPEAWVSERGLEKIVVAVVDGGIEQDHPDLKSNLWKERGFNFVDNVPRIDGDYHGTHVAGTVAAVNNNKIGVSGIAGGSGNGDGVRLMSCQIFGGVTIR